MLYYASDNQIQRYRNKRGLSQKEVALLLGQETQAHLSHWERGSRLPSLVDALKLSAAIGCPVEILFSGLSDRLREDVWRQRRRHGIRNTYDG